MHRQVGILIFTHGSRVRAGNDAMLRLVEHLRQQIDYPHIEACFMELGRPLIPTAIKRLVARGCNHLYGYALFLVPGSHLSEDVPFIFAQTLKNYPHVTWELSPPMLDDPAMTEFVGKHITAALRPAP